MDIRTYDALNQPSMESQEDFLNALNQIKEQFPDLIPLGSNNFETDSTGSLGETLQDYLGVPLENEDGTFYNRNLDEDYLSWMQTLNQAYRNGCISDDSFTDDNTAFQEKVSIGKYACIMLGSIPQLSGYLTSFANEEPDAAYLAIDGPKSTVGNEPKLNQSGISGWMITYISKTCADPAKAIQLYTYLLSEEGQILTNYGIKGETFQINENGSYELLPEMKELEASDNDRFKQEIRIGEFIPFGHDRYKALSEDSFPDSIRQMQEWGVGKLYPHFILENTDPDTGSAEARAYSAIKTNWSTTLIGLVRAQNEDDFENILNSYKAFLDDNSWGEITKIKSEKMASNAEKLGIQ